MSTRLIIQPRQADAGIRSRPILFLQPIRFNRARQRRIMRGLRTKIALGGLMFTAMVLMMLAWKTVEGAHISASRWLLGLCSGWFIMVMMRLALFACLSAPSFIRFRPDGIELSALGVVQPEQVLRWSLARGVVKGRHKPCAHLEMYLQWMGQEKQWSMCLEEGPEADRLRQMLKTACAARRATDWAVEQPGDAAAQAAAVASGLFVPLHS